MPSLAGETPVLLYIHIHVEETSKARFSRAYLDFELSWWRVASGASSSAATSMLRQSPRQQVRGLWSSEIVEATFVEVE
jgi:hypothetical protein